MSDDERLWLEGWKLAPGSLESPESERLIRIKDGVEAAGWYEAAQIEASERGISRSEFLLNDKGKMIPLADTYPPVESVEIPFPRDVTGGPLDPSSPEFQTASQRMLEDVASETDERPWASEPRRCHRWIFWLGWTFVMGGVLLILMAGNLLTAIAAAMILVGGAAIGFFLRS